MKVPWKPACNVSPVPATTSVTCMSVGPVGGVGAVGRVWLLSPHAVARVARGRTISTSHRSRDTKKENDVRGGDIRRLRVRWPRHPTRQMLDRRVCLRDCRLFLLKFPK